MIRPTVLTVVTLGIIGTWQVFDQIYTGTQGGPANTTLTPAYLSYNTSFLNQEWGQGAAIAFILFGIIVIFTILLNYLGRERNVSSTRRRFFRRGPPAAPSSFGGGPGSPGSSQVIIATPPGPPASGGAS
jgi:multiple sugar transport system permease protein